jgi:hypothetical protein
MPRTSFPVKRIVTPPAAVTDFPADYWDCFSTAATCGTARKWAQLSLRGAESAGGIFSLLIWQGVLGFSLDARDASGTVAGWRITDETPQRVVLDADGRLMRGRMVFEIADGNATWTTMVRYHRALARPVWELAAHVHRALVPRSLSGVDRALGRGASNSAPRT